MEKIRLFVTDLDGTLLNGDGKATERGLQMLRKLKAQGVLVAAASGRPLQSICERIPADCLDYAICYNGQQIHDFRHDSDVFFPCLSAEDARRIVAPMRQCRVFMAAYTGESFRYYCDKRHLLYLTAYNGGRNLLRMILFRHRIPGRILTDYREVEENSHPKICFGGFHAALKQVIRLIGPDEYSYAFVNRFWLEIQARGISKGEAIERIIADNHLTREECLAAGDGENDLSMFAACGHSLAMANAMGKAKKAAEYHAGSNLRDGLAAWVEDNILNA